jgi:D-sedoheptulose 7-phosphate isomerase
MTSRPPAMGGDARRTSADMTNDYTAQYLLETARIAERLDQSQINAMIDILVAVRGAGRLFILGVGGSAGNASHAVNDFRKIAGIESYAPTDNVSELTARTNDDGWEGVFAGWLEVSRLSAADVVMVFSVGGGDRDRNVSPNLVAALEFARTRGARIIGVVGRDGGYTAKVADACVIIPPINPAAITPHSEAFQAVVWHLIVSHPRLMRHAMKWEATR